MDEPATVDDDYFDTWQTAGEEALTILAEGFTCVPSFEVFEHGLEACRERAKIAVDIRRYARGLVDEHDPEEARLEQLRLTNTKVGGCGHAKVAVGRLESSAVVEACPVCDFTAGWPSVYTA